MDEALAKEDEITLVVQSTVNCATVPPSRLRLPKKKPRKCPGSEKVQPFIQGKTIVNVIYVPGKLVNIVVK